MDDPTPILRVRPSDISPYTLVCGDPDRARLVSERFEHPRLVGSWREYVSYAGEYRGVRVSVTSHGVGAAGAAICFEELIRAGARTIIRVGTCGSYLSHVRAGGLLIGTAAVREDGVSDQLIPLAFPAVADLDVALALRERAKAHADAQLGVGIMRTHSAFYSGVLPTTQDLWVKAGVIGTEMEYAALLIVAALRGARAGGIFVVDGNPAEEKDMTGYNPHKAQVERAKELMIAIALDSLVALAERELVNPPF